MPNVSNGTNGALSNGHPSSWQAKHDLPSHFIGGNYLDSAPASALKDFVQKSDGHSVITSVRNAVLKYGSFQLTLFHRCSLPTTALQPSKRSDLYENGHIRHLAMSELFNSLSWLLQKIFRQMRTTFEWQTNMLKYVRVREKKLILSTADSSFR
jgi:hypothetical protein